MTAQPPTNTTIAALTAAVTADHADKTARLVLADALTDAGAEYADALAQAERIAYAAWSAEFEGTRVVTVGRDGARTAGHGNAIYVTAIYTATRRLSDGALTWRRTGQVSSHTTAGKKITRPMIDRAETYAASAGLQYLAGIRHGMMCDLCR